MNPAKFWSLSPAWRILATAIGLCLCLSGAWAASPAVRHELGHEASGNEVRFTVPEGAVSVAVQGLSRNGRTWTNLRVMKRPAAGLSSLPVPPKWAGRPLRVVATLPGGFEARSVMEHVMDPDGGGLSFTAEGPALLYSIEIFDESAQAWSRLATVSGAGSTGRVEVPLPSNLPDGAVLRVVRVRAFGPPPSDVRTVLPPGLLNGLSSFAPQQSPRPGPGGLGSAPAPNVSGRPGGEARLAVEESDIWVIRGRRIYLFNELRGLQVIDASDPADPAIAGYLPMHGVGEDLFLLGGDAERASEALLVTHRPWDEAPYGGTRLLRIRFDGDRPEVAGTLDLPGYPVESRLAGGFLHIVTMRWNAENGVWRPEANVISCRVSGAFEEIARRSFAMQSPVVGATGRYLWLAGVPAGGDWRQQQLIALPIQPDGTLGPPRETRVEGWVQDKFKVGDLPGGLAVVLQLWGGPGRPQRTAVETYSESGSSGLARLARLDLVEGESLHATRFDGSRLYAVTFFQVDPLWIVDLSDPSSPAVAGHLEVPGWSSFIEPLGDVLVAVGREGGRVQVSLFDVRDPAAPALSDRVTLGESYSWSEAEWNEKAVKVLPEAGLILVPVVEGWLGDQRRCVRLLGLDLAGRTLRARGSIDHDFAPRRASLLDGALIASVSNRELILVDAANPDAPRVTSEVGLAFGVDHVAAAGGRLYQFENARSWEGDAGTVLRIAPTADPDNVMGEIEIGSSQVVAARVFGDRLVAVETEGPRWLWEVIPMASVAIWPPPRRADTNCSVSIWSLANPLAPALIARIPLLVRSVGDISLLDAGNGRVVVASRASGRWLPFDVPFQTIASRFWPIWPVAGSVEIAVVDAGAPSPALLGSWALEGRDVGTVSDIFAAGDLLLFSHARSEPARGIWSRGGVLLERSFLQVVDLADPRRPWGWAPIALPGPLVGVPSFERAGGIVFTRSRSDGSALAALGIDGERAFLIGEVPVGAEGSVACLGPVAFVSSERDVAAWEFAAGSARWRESDRWSLPGFVRLLATDAGVLAWRHSRVWWLEAGGRAEARRLVPGSRLDAASEWDGALYVPAGEYGTCVVEPPGEVNR